VSRRFDQRRSLAAYSLMACFAMVTPAFGQEPPTPSAADVSLARSLASEGVQLADAGNCAAAIDKLERAETLYHAPTILGRLGECQVAVGRLVMGTETLQRVVRETLPAKAPKAFFDAQVRAKKVLEEALPKVGRLRVHVDVPPVGPPGVRMALKIDGEPVSLAVLDVDRPADPGTHQVEVAAPGFRTAVGETTIEPGASGSVALRLEPDGVAPGAAVAAAPWQGQPPPGAPPGPYPAPPPAASESKGSSKTLGYVALGVGGAGVVVGSIFGVMALSKKSSLDDTCKVKSDCPPTAQNDIDALHTDATVSTVGFVVGGIGLAAGLIVLLTSSSSAPHATTGLAVHPVVTPGSVGAWGSF